MRSLSCRIMMNPRHQHGRAGSLRIGAKAVNRDAEAIIVVDVDQPRPAAFIRALLDARKPTDAVTRPVHGGKRGHPVVVSGALREELMAAKDDDEGLHAVLKAHSHETGDVDAGELLDLTFNTPEEYEAARRRAG